MIFFNFDFVFLIFFDLQRFFRVWRTNILY